MVTKRFGETAGLRSAPEWGAIRDGVERGDILMPDIPDGRTERLEGRYPLRRTDRLAATLVLMRCSR